MQIKPLSLEYQKMLEEFFCSLSDRSVLLMNRFGKVNERKKAIETAAEQCGLPKEKEAGFIMEENGKILGYSFLRFFPDNPRKQHNCIFGIIIADKSQGTGFGKQLTAATIKEAIKIGKQKIWLGVYDFNKPAIKLYKSLGFKKEGIFKKDEIIDGKFVDVISMAKFLK